MNKVYLLIHMYGSDENINILGVFASREKAWARALEHDAEYPGRNWYRVEEHDVE